MQDECLICERISQIKSDTNPYFVKELETGYVVIGDFQLFKGYSLLLCKEHVFELHDLDKDFKQKFLADMAKLAEAVQLAFKPKKLNYELLGNGDPHLHWHIFPRHENDPNPKGVTWNVDREVRYSEKVRPTKEELEIMKQQLLRHL